MTIVEQMLKNAQIPLLYIADISGSALFQGDCLDIMPLIPDKSIQLIYMKYTDGTAVNGCDDHWTVICPECGREIEYEGYFDPDDINECQCGCEFITMRVWLDSEIFI